MDDMSAVLMRLRYASGRSLSVIVRLTGCESVSNGSLARRAGGVGQQRAVGQALVARLKRLSSLI